MNVTVLDRQPDADKQSLLGFVDCDVHPYVKSSADLDPFLSERWREHRQTVGARRGVERLDSQADVLARIVSGRLLQPRHLGTDAAPGLVGAPHPRRQPGHAGLHQHHLQPRKFDEHTLGNQ